MTLSFFKNPGLSAKLQSGITILLATILICAFVNLANAQVATHVWNASVSTAWNDKNNWQTAAGGAVAAPPGPASLVEFNPAVQYASDCVLPNSGSPGTITVARLVIINGYLGHIDINSSLAAPNTLQVSGPATLSSGFFSNSNTGTGTVQINSNSPVTINGLTTASNVALSITVSASGVATSLSSPSASVFNGPVSVSALDNITLSGAKFYNAVTVTKTGGTNFTLDGSSSNTFTGATGSVTIQNNGSGNFSYINETFDKPLILQNNSSGTLTGDLVTITPNGTTTMTSNSGTVIIDRLTANGNASATSNGTGTLQIERATFNKDLTLTGNSGVLNAGYTNNCKLVGNLTVNGAVSFGNGLSSSGAIEFIGLAAQTVTSASALTFTKIFLNKSYPASVTLNSDAIVTYSATLTNGVIVMGNNTLSFATPAVVASFTTNSFVDGLVKFNNSASGSVTFPTGSATGLVCRPVTLNFSEALTNISARYVRSGPSSTAVNAPLTNVSTFENWVVTASPSLGFTASLSWRNADSGNSNYVTDTDQLKVARYEGAVWQSYGGANDGGSASNFAPFAPVILPQGGIVTSKTINLGGSNIGNLTLGSTNAVANQLARLYLTCKWRAYVNSQWTNAGNWENGVAPDGNDIAVFDGGGASGNTPCVLPANVVVGAIEMFSPYTGNIDLAGRSLTVTAIAPTIINAGNFIGVAGSSLTVNGGAFPVDIRGTSAPSTAAVTISSNAVTMGSSAFSGTVTLPAATNIGVTGDLSFGRIVYSANMNLNGFLVTINASGSTNTFTNGSITNSGLTKTVSVFNTAAGGTTINGTSFGTGVDLNVQSGDIVLNGGTFNVSSFTKTNNTANTSNGGNVFNGNTTLINTGTAMWTMSSTTQDTFNKDLTLTATTANTIAGCTNCKLGGNLTLTNIPAFNVGTIEFIGGSAQDLRGSSLLTATVGIVLNKTGGAPVRSFLGSISAPNINFTNGTLSGYVSLGTYTGGSSVSYLDSGPVTHSGAGAFTFPLGNAGSYRPATISPDASGFGVSYFKGTPNSGVTSVSGFNNYSQCEYWVLTYVDDTPSFSLTLSWVSAECTTPITNYVANLADLRVVYQNYNFGSPTSWTDKGNTATTGTIAAGTVKSTAMSINVCNGCYWRGYFTLGSETGINPLPIELSDFSGELLPGGDVKLDWITASETNNNLFEIERSGNGTDFEKIGAVDGHGTTTVLHKYSWLDAKPLSGLSYYRLRQVDFDEQSTYSNVISVSNGSKENKFSVYPVPASDKLFLSVKDDVKIVDVLGNVVCTGHDVDEINLEALKPGVYCIMIPSGEACRFVKN